jgi:hypothetical protein
MQKYTNAQYYCILGTSTIAGIKVDIDGVPSFVPIDPANTDYANMMVLVSEGQIVIAPAA